MEPNEPVPSRETPATVEPVRTEKQTSYGALIAIVVIVAIVVVGAFYAWGKKIAERQAPLPVGTTTVSE
ncbi:MAG: hypothetical protein WDN10_03595 [bacterium]